MGPLMKMMTDTVKEIDGLPRGVTCEAIREALSDDLR